MANTTENQAISEEITTLLTDKVAQWGLFLEKVRVKGSKNSRRVEVLLDLPQGDGEVDFACLQQVSQKISQLMDEANPVDGAYNLEVSTLGAEHVLDNRRLFARAVGKDVEIKLGGKTRQGKIVNVEGDEFTWEENGKQETIAFSELESARTVILFATGASSKKSQKSGKKNNRTS